MPSPSRSNRTGQPRLLFVHAHPDDETLTTGATIAHYTARGAHVEVITCTLGEEGEVIGDRWALLTADHADQLGGYRIGELTAALRALGVAAPEFLGGAGRWRDSGMAEAPARRGRRFIDQTDEPVAALVTEIRRLRPHVVVTYDPEGGYGHPDHVHAHRITVAAVAAAAGDEYPGRPWAVPKLYWTVVSTTAVRAARRRLRPEDLLSHWRSSWPAGEGDRDDQVIGGYPDERIDAVIEDRAAATAKRAGLAAHATQVALGATGRAYALSNDIVQPIPAGEHFVLAAGTAGPRDDRGWETDLLGGVDLNSGQPAR